VKHEVYSRDTVMHVGMSDLWFSKRSRSDGKQVWRQRKCEYSDKVKRG